MTTQATDATATLSPVEADLHVLAAILNPDLLQTFKYAKVDIGRQVDAIPPAMMGTTKVRVDLSESSSSRFHGRVTFTLVTRSGFLLELEGLSAALHGEGVAELSGAISGATQRLASDHWTCQYLDGEFVSKGPYQSEIAQRIEVARLSEAGKAALSSTRTWAVEFLLIQLMMR